MPQPGQNDLRLLTLHPNDNVCTAAAAIAAGTSLEIGGRAVVVSRKIPLGFKVAARAIHSGEKILKYGVPIGSATREIAAGEIVHLDNMKSDYLPTYTLDD